MTNSFAGFEQFTLALANAHKTAVEKYNRELDAHKKRIQDDPSFTSDNPFDWVVRRAQIDTIGAMIGIAKDTMERIKMVDLVKSS